MKEHENTSPEKRDIVFSVFERQHPKISKALKSFHSFKCQLCGWHGFKTKFGGRYIEIHHLIPLSKKGTNNLNNLVVVCPNHHKMLDFCEAEITTKKSENERIAIYINKKKYNIKRNIFDTVMRSAK